MAAGNGRNGSLEHSFLCASNTAYLEELLYLYQRSPSSVDEGWHEFLSELVPGSAKDSGSSPGWRRADWPKIASDDWIAALDGNWSSQKVVESTSAVQKNLPTSALSRTQISDSLAAFRLIEAYRAYGHLVATIDPLDLSSVPFPPCLKPESYGFGEKDLDRQIDLNGLLGFESTSIRELRAALQSLYCSSVGAEFVHIPQSERREWVRARIEGGEWILPLSPAERLGILDRLVSTCGLEQFLDLKYTGTKRFGIDGGEAMIPMLEEIIQCGVGHGVREIVIGMAHRGRLTTLTQILEKPYRALFHEFRGGSPNPEWVQCSGDVKYHLGASCDRAVGDRRVHLSLMPNPSHLEIVDPVVLGKVRARQDALGCAQERNSVLPLLIHGDAAFAGQGVVPECFGLSGLEGYRTGGSLHIIVNNQVGFTASPRESRSSVYPSDLVKMAGVPVFHVNADDPEMLIRVARVAVEFRQLFNSPVIIDLVCYRRFGHNEVDEPSFTQPLMYKHIRNRERIVDLYGKQLVAQGLLDDAGLEARKVAYRAKLDRELEAAEGYKPEKRDCLEGAWSGVLACDDEGGQSSEVEKTGLKIELLRLLGKSLCTVPQGFSAHRTIMRFLDKRRETIMSGIGIDWATAEALAFAALLKEGHAVRLSGQDSERGTFSQRHSVLVEQETEVRYIPLNHLGGDQARYEVINSMLSEEAVLGFEYGYSLAAPHTLVLWEAQFGDFANGAQVLFDQFIASSEQKWLRMSGLVCLLPHGYEGQGPEHSSARLERYLQLCAQNNMQVANCTTPANYFHILRRQLKRPFRKPLILMTPKSLLRHKYAISTLEAFGSDSSFQPVLRDNAESLRGGEGALLSDFRIRRVILCSGKVYYDLYEEREARKITDVYLLRLEELYPFPSDKVFSELSRFPRADIVWCQEEPRNMGAWGFVKEHLEDILERTGGRAPRLRYVGRAAAAVTATGQMSQHVQQLKALFEEAFAPG